MLLYYDVGHSIEGGYMPSQHEKAVRSFGRKSVGYYVTSLIAIVIAFLPFALSNYPVVAFVTCFVFCTIMLITSPKKFGFDMPQTYATLAVISLVGGMIHLDIVAGFIYAFVLLAGFVSAYFFAHVLGVAVILAAKDDDSK